MDKPFPDFFSPPAACSLRLASDKDRGREDWRKEAACRFMNPSIFFKERGESARDARSICATCPVSVDCLLWAVDTNEREGIWGGVALTPRRWLRRALLSAGVTLNKGLLREEDLERVNAFEIIHFSRDDAREHGLLSDSK